MNNAHDLHRETKAVEALRAGLLKVTDDKDVIRDTIEGASNLHEIIRAVLLSVEEDQAMVDGISARMEDLGERRRRFKDRIEAKRAQVEQAMLIGEMKMVECDLGTFYLTSVPPKAVPADESAIPSEFFEPQAPKLDTRKLLAALKEGRAIPGAHLSNGGVTLALRRK
jgi:hypothetical protein